MEDGTIRSLATGKRVDISTERSFRNFALMFDWKLAKGANSGVKYLVFGMRSNPEAELVRKFPSRSAWSCN